ncbi:MAG: DUF6057 family protein, partial [Planctomycetota bacterium]
GGPVEYLCAFLSQLLYYSWAGALVITTMALLISICTDIFIKEINAPRLRWIRFIPPVLILITYNKYTYHFVTIMALLGALSFVCLYLKLTKINKVVSLLIFFVLSAILYYIAGGVYLLFVLLCAIYELLFRRQWQIASVYLLSAAVIPYVGGVLVFSISVNDAFTQLLPFSWKNLSHEDRRRMVDIVYILYLLLPLAALGFGLWRLFAGSLTSLPNQKNTNEADPNEIKNVSPKLPLRILSWYADAPLLRWLAELCLLLVLPGTIAFSSHDDELKTIIEVDYYACRKMWPQVLHAARRYPNNFLIVHTANRALYHTGRLGYDMFSFPQRPNTLFLPTGKKNSRLLRWKRFDMYIDLGFMNNAEGELAELLEAIGEHPVILKRLALINMVKDNLGAARIYLRALSNTLFYADWANNYLALLRSDPCLLTDVKIQHLRNLKPENDDENVLSALLTKSTHEQMAFEYFMALHLLAKQLDDKFIQNLALLKNFAYPEIPQHYQEAILLYTFEKRKAVDLYGYRLNPELHQQFQKFARLLKRYGKDNRVAFNKLAKDYGDTYLFYYTYGASGMKK